MTRTSRYIRQIMCGAALISVSASSALAGDTVFRVDLNKTQVLRLPMAAGSVIIGNPNIADVSIHSSQTIFVVGRGFGETNLIILDQAGQTMMDADIQVTAITPSHGVRVFNASSRQTYSCAPFCQPSPVMGDDAGFVGANSGQTGGTISQDRVIGPPSDFVSDSGISASGISDSGDFSAQGFSSGPFSGPSSGSGSGQVNENF